VLTSHCAALRRTFRIAYVPASAFIGAFIVAGWLYSGAVGVVRGAILSAEAPPIISQLAADCVQSPIELRAAIAPVK